MVGYTYTAVKLREQIQQLQDLLTAYREGTIKEQED